MTRGSLCAVGIGIRAPSQTTLEASSRIRGADKVFCIVADLFSQYWVSTMNPTAESLAHLYAVGKERIETYEEMVERILEAVRAPASVCAVSYGHPGVAAYPLHESVRRARAEGFFAEMLPAVSAEDCLFVDVGVDPVQGGCRSYEATDFLVHRRAVDPTSNLILWQVGAIGEPSVKLQKSAWNRDGVIALAETLLKTYPQDHEVVVYEAAQLPLCPSRIERIRLRDLASADITPVTTLLVPPSEEPSVDEAMLRRLGLTE